MSESPYYTVREARNPKWANEEHNVLDIEVNFIDIEEEWINYTASPTDVSEHSREIYRRALEGEYGEIAEYEDVNKWIPVNKTEIKVSTEGLIQILLEKGVLTDEEVDTILVEETNTVGFARTATDGISKIY